METKSIAMCKEIVSVFTSPTSDGKHSMHDKDPTQIR